MAANSAAFQYLELLVFWVAHVDPGAQHLDRASANRRRAPMSNGIHAASQSAYDCQPRDAGRTVRHRRALDRWSPGAHGGQARRVQYAGVAADVQHHRWNARDLRTVIVDVTALGNDSSVTQLTLRSDTDLTKGPQPMTLSVARTLAQGLRYRFPAHCSPESEARLSSIIDECC